MAREYFNAYHSYLENMKRLSDAEVGRLFRALLKYSMTGILDDLPGNERFVVDGMTAQIDRDSRKYEEKCKLQQDKANKRWHATACNGMPDDAEHAKEKEKEKEKEKKNIDDDTDARASAPDLGTVMRKYMELIQDVSPSFVTDFLKSYTDDLGAEVVCYAIEKAASENVHKWSYIRSILQDYTKKGIRTLAAAQRDAEEFQRRKSGKKKSTGAETEEKDYDILGVLGVKL